MSTLSRRLLATAAVALSALAAAPVSADTPPRVSGPFVHDNLAVYFVHGASAPGKAPLTLQEALARKLVVVHETGDVNRLAIENRGPDEVFVQSGDIVKGGQQDRVLTVSLMLPPRSGRVPIAAFCVEQGRWAARGAENAKAFESAASAVPSRDAKLAMKAPLPAGAGAGGRGEIGQRQHDVWSQVANTQDKLARSLGAPVAASESRSSLPLALENGKVGAERAAYAASLRAAGERDPDIVGFVFAVNGRLNSADAYASNALFRKMWSKLLDAAATEAIGERAAAAASPPPSTADVAGFLAAAEGGKPTRATLERSIVLETRDADRALFFETSRADGSWFHRNYLAK
jgi:hypothetical protein